MKITVSPQIRTVYCQLDRERALRWTTNGMCNAEALGGRAIGTILAQGVGRETNFSNIRLLLYALLYHEDPALELEQVGDMIDGTEDKQELYNAMGVAIAMGNSADPELAFELYKQSQNETKAEIEPDDASKKKSIGASIGVTGGVSQSAPLESAPKSS